MRQESVMQSANFKGMANMYLRASRGGTEPCGERGRMTKRSGIGSCWVEKGKSEGERRVILSNQIGNWGRAVIRLGAEHDLIR